MSVGLSWLLSYATNNIHNKAMQEQANAVAEHLSVGPDGRLQLNLPSDLLGLYSPEYGRYAYAVVDDSGAVLFSSAKDHTALFPADLRSGEVEFLQHRRGSATVSGASVRKTIGDRTVWVQAGEDLANRDVLTDDIVADFYRDVGWITLPILLVLLITDIAIFRRALRPLRQAPISPPRSGRRAPAYGCRPTRFRARFARWSRQSIWGSTGWRKASRSSATLPPTPHTSYARP